MNTSFGAQDAAQLTQSARRWLALLKRSLPSPEELGRNLGLENDIPGKPVGPKQVDSPCPTDISAGRPSPLDSSISSQQCAQTGQITSSNPNQASSNVGLASLGDSKPSLAVAALNDGDCVLQQVADEIRQETYTTSNQLQAFKVTVPKGYPGIQYRKSTNLEDRYERYAKRGTVVTGEVEDGGSWLKIGSNVFLPMRVAGLDVLEPADAGEAEAARAEMSEPLSQDAYPWLTVFSCGQFYDN